MEWKKMERWKDGKMERWKERREMTEERAPLNQICARAQQLVKDQRLQDDKRMENKSGEKDKIWGIEIGVFGELLYTLFLNLDTDAIDSPLVCVFPFAERRESCKWPCVLVLVLRIGVAVVWSAV
jgi:hypothetical protein